MPRRRCSWATRWLVLSALMCGGCAAILGGDDGIAGLDGSTDGGKKQDGTFNDALRIDAGADHSHPRDGGPEDTGPRDTSADAGGGCPGTGGPIAVPAGSFCIDSTEVTNAQYAKFVEAGVDA